MAVPGIPTVGSIDTQAIGAAANKGALYFATVSLYLLILLGGLGLFAFLLYKKTFNIRITVLDSNGILVRDDYKGKLNQVRPGEFRFQIYQAKRHKLRYNQESLSPDDLTNDVSARGKVSKRLFVTIDSEGQLVPLKIEFKKKLVPVTDSTGLPMMKEDGTIEYEETTTAVAKVKQVDIAWFYKEYDKSGEVFDARSFFDKNGWLILVICLVLTLGVFLYTAYKFGAAATKMGDVVKAQGDLIRFMELARNGTVVPV